MNAAQRIFRRSTRFVRFWKKSKIYDDFLITSTSILICVFTCKMRGRPPKRCPDRRSLLKVQSNFVRENRGQNEGKRRRIRHESYSYSVTFQPVAILHEKTQGKTKVTQTRAGGDLAPRVCPPDPQRETLNENPSPGGLSGKIVKMWYITKFQK